MPLQAVPVAPWCLLSLTARCHDNKLLPSERCVKSISHAFLRLQPCQQTLLLPLHLAPEAPDIAWLSL